MTKPLPRCPEHDDVMTLGTDDIYQCPHRETITTTSGKVVPVGRCSHSVTWWPDE